MSRDGITGNRVVQNIQGHGIGAAADSSAGTWSMSRRLLILCQTGRRSSRRVSVKVKLPNPSPGDGTVLPCRRDCAAGAG